MRLIDSHCHIADCDFPLPQNEVLTAAAAAHVVKMITIGTDEMSSRQAVKFASQHSNVWASVGVHPHTAQNGVAFLQQLDFSNPKIVAVGEIGLDYHYDFSPREVQQQVLRQQIELGLEYNLPIIFHVREAFADFWKIVADYTIPRAVVHSFSDNLANLEQILAKNWFIGVNGLVTFTKDTTQKQAFAAIPLEKLLLETDAPYMTPVPLRGRPNQPAYVTKVAEFLAAERQITLEKLAETTSQNAELLFSL